MSNQEYIKLSHQVTDRFVKDYSRRTGVRICGSGGGMVDDIDTIILTFVGYDRLDVPAARRLYMDGLEDILHRYNTNKTVRPYLHNFPFVSDNVEIDLIFEKKSGGFVDKEFVASVMNVYDKICYNRYDPERKRLVKFHEEPYEEALRIVHAEREQAKGQ